MPRAPTQRGPPVDRLRGRRARARCQRVVRTVAHTGGRARVRACAYTRAHMRAARRPGPTRPAGGGARRAGCCKARSVPFGFIVPFWIRWLCGVRPPMRVLGRRPGCWRPPHAAAAAATGKSLRVCARNNGEGGGRGRGRAGRQARRRAAGAAGARARPRARAAAAAGGAAWVPSGGPAGAPGKSCCCRPRCRRSRREGRLRRGVTRVPRRRPVPVPTRRGKPAADCENREEW